MASHGISCAELGKVAYFSGFNHSKLYMFEYDSTIFDYKEVLDVQKETTKVIITCKLHVYVIENYGRIYTAFVGQKQKFTVIGSASFESGWNFGVKLELKEYGYFGVGNNIYKLDVKGKRIHQLTLENE